MSPPETAVSLVDLCRHSEMETGENSRETQLHRGDNQSDTGEKYLDMNVYYTFVSVRR